MARRADDKPLDPAVVVINPDDDVTPETFNVWLDQRQSGEPLQLRVTAAETLSEARGGRRGVTPVAPAKSCRRAPG